MGGAVNYYWYKRGGWEIAVDAMSKHDADQYIKIHAPGAKFVGSWVPSSSGVRSTATGAVTAKRQAQIHETLEREYQAYKAENNEG
jgi:hypothetical protein